MTLLLRFGFLIYVGGSVTLWVRGKQVNSSSEVASSNIGVPSPPLAAPSSAKNSEGDSKKNQPPSADSIFRVAPNALTQEKDLGQTPPPKSPPVKTSSADDPEIIEKSAMEFTRKAMENENLRSTARTRGFYASQVDYSEDVGVISFEEVLRDKDDYFRNYPSGDEIIKGDVIVEQSGTNDCNVKFSTNFTATDRQGGIRKGSTNQTWHLERPSTSGNWEITRQRLSVSITDTIPPPSKQKVQVSATTVRAAPTSNLKPVEAAPPKSQPKDWRKTAQSFENR